MIIEALADTHAVLWYLIKDIRLSSTARATIEQSFARGNAIGISTISLDEIVYLIIQPYLMKYWPL